MEQIRSLEDYKELLRQNKERIGKPEKNCILLAATMESYITEGRLYAETYENGLAVFQDEGRYYNLYYFWKKGAVLADFRQEKPVLIEELNNRGSRDAYLAEFEPLLFAAGFEAYKNNVQVELNLRELDSKAGSEAASEAVSDKTEEKGGLEAKLAQKMDRLSGQGLRLKICEDDMRYAEAVALWKSGLNVTDIPQDHMTREEDAVLAYILNEEGKMVATHWWKNSGASSEGRHAVTDPDYYQRGLASTLLLTWCQDALQQGCIRAITWISDTNFPSLTMCKKLGFLENGRTSKQYILKTLKQGE